MELLTRNELMKKLRISRSAVYRWEKLGMPVKRLSPGTKRYDFDEIMAWVQDKNDIARNIN